jgi:hypothetical protein
MVTLSTEWLTACHYTTQHSGKFDSDNWRDGIRSCSLQNRRTRGAFVGSSDKIAIRVRRTANVRRGVLGAQVRRTSMREE